MSVDLAAGVSYRDRAAWLRGRRIGASSVAAVLGVSPYRGPWDVWRELRGEATERVETPDQLRGRRWEARVLEEYQYETGRPVSVPARPSIWTGPNAWETATPDGFALDGGELGVVEAKTDRVGSGWRTAGDLDRWVDGAELVVRPDYAIQCYWLTRCTGAPWCDLAVLLPRYELRTFRLWSDPATEEALGEAVAAWYRRHIVEGERPDPDASDACRDHARARLAAARGRRPLLEATGELADQVEELAAARRDYRVAKQLAEEVSASLALRLLDEGAAGYRLEDGRSARWTSGRAGHFRLYGFAEEESTE